MRVTVLGAGSWGTALAILLARNGHDVFLFGRDVEHIASIGSIRENLRYLPGFPLPESIAPLHDVTEIGGADLWVMAVPSSAVRAESQLIQGASPNVLIATKGLEPGTAMLMDEVVREVVSGAVTAAVSGPNLAIEIVRGIPTAAVSASKSPEMAELARSALMCRTYRVYVSPDIVGVELAGSLKNVLAIGAGMSDGLGFGDNTKGALLARGLGEMTALGLAMGGCRETFMGIAGVGDLFATASSNLSRNYRVGRMVGEGHALSDALHTIDQVAEGVNTAEASLTLARRHSVEMPVFAAIDAVLRGRMKPLEGVSMLMERMPKSEWGD